MYNDELVSMMVPFCRECWCEPDDEISEYDISNVDYWEKNITLYVRVNNKLCTMNSFDMIVKDDS